MSCLHVFMSSWVESESDQFSIFCAWRITHLLSVCNQLVWVVVLGELDHPQVSDNINYHPHSLRRSQNLTFWAHSLPRVGSTHQVQDVEEIIRYCNGTCSSEIASPLWVIHHSELTILLMIVWNWSNSRWPDGQIIRSFKPTDLVSNLAHSLSCLIATMQSGWREISHHQGPLQKI
jgi:hypothetical protein